MPADISIREQREAVELAAEKLCMFPTMPGHTRMLVAAALTLAKVERGELVPSPSGFGEYSSYHCTCGRDATAVCPIHGMQTL